MSTGAGAPRTGGAPGGAAPPPPGARPPGPVPLSGDSGCVLATSSLPGRTDACARGPVARYVWDLADRDSSRWIVPFGASGRPSDRHFADQLSHWAAGRLIGVPTGDPRPAREDG
jgi:penicillin G amidase